jgi:type II secretory pathway pseudopilin PulG
MMQQRKHTRGFSLLELMVSMVLGFIVMGSMVQLFSMGMKSTKLVSQRAEMQQNMRAAIELMSKDISLAGAGLPAGGIQLPNGVGSQLSLFGCDLTGVCHIPTTDTYPVGNHMYPLIPGYLSGVENNTPIPSAPGAPCSSITVVYVDPTFALSQWNMTFPNPNGTSVNLVANPAFPAAPVMTSPGGLQVGDLIWLQNNLGSAVGDVTGFTNATIAFADGDPLRINQSTAGLAHNIRSIAGQNATGSRIFVVTYYLSVPATPGQNPRLMRQVNGLAPVPVADDIINIQFAYDSYNTLVNPPVLDANQPNPIGVGDSLSLIQKVNIAVMGQALGSAGNNQQNMALTTSVSARNMSFADRYK